MQPMQFSVISYFTIFSIQDFKGQFNARGEGLGIGHLFGDFGIQAVAENIADALKEAGVPASAKCKFYNNSKDFIIISEDIEPEVLEKAIKKMLPYEDVLSRKEDFKKISDCS